MPALSKVRQYRPLLPLRFVHKILNFDWQNLTMMNLLIKPLLSCLLLGTLTLSHAEIIPPDSGDGELILVLYSSANKHSLAIDLGVTISAFKVANSQGFDLTPSQSYESFVKEAKGQISFIVIGADSSGPISVVDSRQLLVTSVQGSAVPAPTNSDLSTFAGRLNTYQKALNTTADWADFSGTHNAKDNGSSIDRVSGGSTSFQVLNLGILSQVGAKMAASGSKAELVSIKSVDGIYSSRAAVVEHKTYFTLDLNAGSLVYSGSLPPPSRPIQ
jgi:hypothetical protein